MVTKEKSFGFLQPVPKEPEDDPNGDFFDRDRGTLIISYH